MHGPIGMIVFNQPPAAETYTLSLHDALPICAAGTVPAAVIIIGKARPYSAAASITARYPARFAWLERSEEHTSELQSRHYLVCRLLLEKRCRPPKAKYFVVADGFLPSLPALF